MQFAQLVSLREAGVPIPDDIILDASTMQNKKQLMEAVSQASQKRAEMEQMAQQVGMQEQMAKIELAQARATADRGLGFERASRIEENKALAQEREAMAEKDRMAAVLELVKAMKEIDDVDIQQIHKLMSISSMLKSQQKEEALLQSQLSSQKQEPQPAPVAEPVMGS